MAYMDVPSVTAQAFGGLLPELDAPADQRPGDDPGLSSDSEEEKGHGSSLPERGSPAASEEGENEEKEGTDPFQNYAQTQKEERDKAIAEGRPLETVPALPEKESFRPDDPKSIAEEKVRQAALKEQ